MGCIWKPIGHTGYTISNHGTVLNADRNLVRATADNLSGRDYIAIEDSLRYIAETMLTAHKGSVQDDWVASWINGNRACNHLGNVRWAATRGSADWTYSRALIKGRLEAGVCQFVWDNRAWADEELIRVTNLDLDILNYIRGAYWNQEKTLETGSLVHGPKTVRLGARSFKAPRLTAAQLREIEALTGPSRERDKQKHDRVTAAKLELAAAKLDTAVSETLPHVEALAEKFGVATKVIWGHVPVTGRR